eukprot:226597-Pleurochrysis_carterae.AAC.1
MAGEASIAFPEASGTRVVSPAPLTVSSAAVWGHVSVVRVSMAGNLGFGRARRFFGAVDSCGVAGRRL